MTSFLRIELQNVNEGRQWTAHSNRSRVIVVGQNTPEEALRLMLRHLSAVEPCSEQESAMGFRALQAERRTPSAPAKEALERALEKHAKEKPT